MEIKIKDVVYRTGQLDAFAQFHIWRRVMPIIVELGISMREAFSASPKAMEMLKDLPKLKDGETLPPDQQKAVAAAMSGFEGELEGHLLAAYKPAIQVLARMSNEDSEYVVRTCLAAVTRASGQGWAPVMTKEGVVMFQDMGVQEVLQLSAAVIRGNMSNFFDALPTLG